MILHFTRNIYPTTREGERVRVYRVMFALPEAQIVYSGMVVNEPLRSLLAYREKGHIHFLF